METGNHKGAYKMKTTGVAALAVMLGVGYLVFKAGGSGFAAPSSSVSSGSVSAPSGGYVGGGSAGRSVLTFAPSRPNPIVDSGLPEWFIRSVETPLPKRFVGKIYERNIAAIKGRGL